MNLTSVRFEVRLDSSRKLDGDREANLDILYDGCWGMRRMSLYLQ
jgi:hypothetical protein